MKKFIEVDALYGKASFSVDDINIVYAARKDWLDEREIKEGVQTLIDMKGGRGSIRVITPYKQVLALINQSD